MRYLISWGVLKFFILKALITIKRRMTTLKKTKISDGQTNIDKYRLAANITEYHIISKLIISNHVKIYVKKSNSTC